MPKPLRLLLLEDCESDVRLVLHALRAGGFDPDWTRVQTEQDFAEQLDLPFDLILADFNLPQYDALRALRLVRARDLDIPFIIVSGSIGEDAAVEALHMGATDYLLKDRLNRLGQAVDRALEGRRLLEEKRNDEKQLRERARLACLMSDVGVALTTAHTMRDMLRLCVESMVRNLDAAFVRIWTLNEAEDVLELEASAGLYTHVNGPHGRVPVGQLKIGLIAQERKPHLTNDVCHDPRVSDPEWAKREGMVAFAGYPLASEDRLVGVMALFARHPLTDATLYAMGAIANQISTGIIRKRTEKSLQQTNDMLRSLIHAAPLAIVAVDGDLKVLEWNPQAERLFGWTSGEVMGRSLPIVPAAEWDAVLAEAREVRGFVSSSGTNLRRLRRDGSPVDVGLWTAPLRDDQGRVTGSLHLMADFTDRNRLEEQFRKAQKMEAVGRLAGGVAHDFNNVLTVILGFCDVVLESLPVDHAVVGDMLEIKRAAERAASLTRQLLAFSRRQILSPKILDLNLLIREMQKMLARIVGEDVDLRLVLDEAIGQIEADPGQVEQVILNLAVNARDAMPRGGRLILETHNAVIEESFVDSHFEARKGNYVLLVVTDNGIGMDAATRAQIFEPFFTTKEEGKGTGLGLATVYGIVKQSRGFISVYSEPGKGTAFKVYFPRIDVPAAGQAPVGCKPELLMGTETILLAEDESTLRTLAERVLTSHGYNVLQAADGTDAIAQIESHRGPIHLLITDVIMPGAGGREVAECAQRKFPGIKVLYISGYTDDAIMLSGVLTAEMPFLHKPFSPQALARSVRSTLDGSAKTVRAV